MSHLWALLRLSARPATIIYPYPIAALIAFSFSDAFNVTYLIRAIIFSFIFYAGVNLWNHVNDVKEDIAGGKKTVITENPDLKEIFIIIPILLYIISFVLTIIWSFDTRGIIAFLAASFATWIYSDRIFLGKKFGRWKDHYLTETLAFIIFFPSFFSTLWTIFKPLSMEGVAFSLILSLFLLSGAFLKDIRDIAGDRLAGLKTLGVMFSSEFLLKLSFSMLLCYYILILIFSLWLKLLPFFSSLSILFLLGFGYTLLHFLREDWEINSKSIRPLHVMYYSNLGSLLMLIFSGFI